MWLFALSACVAPPTSGDEEPPPDGFVTPNEDFFVLQIGAVPELDPLSWRLAIDGEISQAAEISLFDLLALGTRERMQTLACGGANPTWPAVGNAVWGGLPLLEVLDAFGATVLEEATEMHVFAADGYSAAIPISDLHDREVWLVWEMNNERLPAEHGYPARLLVSDLFASESVKWLTRITFSTEHLTDYSEERWGDYADDPTYRPICFFTGPANGAEVGREPIELEGNAFCGGAAVTRVEVSTDDATTWQRAETYEGPANVWALWSYRWRPLRSGAVRLLARVGCADGRRSNPAGNDLLRWDGYGWVDVSVR